MRMPTDGNISQVPEIAMAKIVKGAEVSSPKQAKGESRKYGSTVLM